MQSYRELLVWQKSIELVAEIYKLISHFPKSELFALTTQVRRAAVSIPSNIAEGYTHKHKAEYIQFLRIAFGSGAELETQLCIAKKVGLAEEKLFMISDGLLSEVMRMLNKLQS